MSQIDWQGVTAAITAIFSGIAMVISAIAAVYAARAHAAGARNETALAENTAITEVAATTAKQVKKTTEAVATAVTQVKEATNGMKDDLITAVREQALQAGEIKGRAEAEKEAHG